MLPLTRESGAPMQEECEKSRKTGVRVLTLAEAIGGLRFDMDQRCEAHRHHAGQILCRHKINVN